MGDVYPGIKATMGEQESQIIYYMIKMRARDLANKMQMMINLSKEDRRLMGEAGRSKILKEFDEKIVIEKYLKTIEGIFVS